jgi:hypothetical protein
MTAPPQPQQECIICAMKSSAYYPPFQTWTFDEDEVVIGLDANHLVNRRLSVMLVWRTHRCERAALAVSWRALNSLEKPLGPVLAIERRMNAIGSMRLGLPRIPHAREALAALVVSAALAFVAGEARTLSGRIEWTGNVAGPRAWRLVQVHVDARRPSQSFVVFERDVGETEASRWRTRALGLTLTVRGWDVTFHAKR